VWSDFWIAIPLAVVITLVRLFVSDPISTRLCVAQLGLARHSLRDTNAKQEAGKRMSDGDTTHRESRSKTGMTTKDMQCVLVAERASFFVFSRQPYLGA